MDFDEGFYLASLGALREGQTLGTQVFAPQPPGFYTLLRLAGSLVGPNPEQVREGFIALAVLGTFGAFALARGLGAGFAALIAPALLVIAPPVPEDTARVWADLPSLWVSLVAAGLASLAARRRDRTGTALAGLAGATTVAAVSVKIPAVIIAPVVLVLLLDAPEWRRRLVAGGAGAAAALAALLIANWGALGDLWQSVIVYHSRATNVPPALNRNHEIHKLFDARTPYFWLVVAGALALIFSLVQRRARAGELALWAWAIFGFLFLLWFSPLHYNHLVYLPVPLAVAGGVSLGRVLAQPFRWRAAASVAVMLALAAGWTQQLHRVDIERAPNTTGDVAAAAILSRVTKPSDYVVSDMPVAAVLAHRTMPGPLVELGHLRFYTRMVTPALVLKTIDTWCVQAAVEGRAFTKQPIILAGLRARFHRMVRRSGANVYFDPRRSCSGSSS